MLCDSSNVQDDRNADQADQQSSDVTMKPKMAMAATEQVRSST